eukprot:2487569-Ditylum_brightwellii.AAC.1
MEELDNKAIPQPQLLIKDHKKLKSDGNFPTWLVIPTTNFTATFSKIGYMGIKGTLDEHKVNYSKHTIIQASDLKHYLEVLHLTADKVTLMSLDIDNMYPSIRVKLIQKAMDYCTSNLPISARKAAQKCMEIVKFGMKSMLIRFRDKYYKYNGVTGKDNVSDEDIGLAIGGYKSAFLANIVASY